MKSLLQHCQDLPRVSLAPGQIILAENGQTNQLYVLEKGVIEVYRGDETITMVAEPGAIFGEMSVLLDIPHTASVRATVESQAFLVNDASSYLASNPDFLLPIARMLANRLRNSTTYLIDIKKQFKEHSDHFGMVDEVLETMAHEQEEIFTPDEDLPIDP